jgi:NAD(P)H-nitrite reductase large subunit
VAVAIGVLPRKELALDAGLACGRGVLVDQHLRSDDEDIFAAGDLAEVAEASTGKRTLEVLWDSAVAKGRVAGRNMAAGNADVYRKDTPLNVTRLGGWKISIMGRVGGGGDPDVGAVSRGDSETWRRRGEDVTVESDHGGTRLRLALSEQTIEGAVVMGDQSVSFPLQQMVSGHADLSRIMPALRAPAAPLIDLVYDFWSDWRTQLAQAQS